MTSPKHKQNKTNVPVYEKDMGTVVERKIDFFKNIISKTVIHVQNLKLMGILGISDVNTCVEKLGEQSQKVLLLEDTFATKENEEILQTLQAINNELSLILKSYGTQSFEDCLIVCFGSNSQKVESDTNKWKMEILLKHFHPTGYRLLNTKKPSEDPQFDEKTTPSLTCVDTSSGVKGFQMKVHGIKVYVYNNVLKKSIVILGFLDNVVLSFLNNKEVDQRRQDLSTKFPVGDPDFAKPQFTYFLDSLTLKDYIVQDVMDLFGKYKGYLSKVKSISDKSVEQNAKDFMSEDLYAKRMKLIYLLIDSDNSDHQYLAYLLYDLLSNEANDAVDSKEQMDIFDSLPWLMKKHFKSAMKNTIEYTNELSHFDIHKIPLEQQICLMKASDSVKEKAMSKMKEIKSKTEDSGSKARQYLEGLLKVPFGIYKKEPCLHIMDEIRDKFGEMCKKYDIEALLSLEEKKEKYTSIEIIRFIARLEIKLSQWSNEQKQKLLSLIQTSEKTELQNWQQLCLNIIDRKDIFPFNAPMRKKAELKQWFSQWIQHADTSDATLKQIDSIISGPSPLFKELQELKVKLQSVSSYMRQVRETLDKAVYGHETPKRQLERIIGQWINGKTDGYCIGVGGPPGVGKTSIIKEALANCLLDENGNSRPFHMIQLGGDSNGSSLIGHSYTYVGSSWGSIVQILIDSKCMNPIIFIDEVDKVSKTEHGREIVGILTHLLDPAQNDVFQDKYFSGIELDLSKALFVLSYNDESLIDRILLDRVHRIRFDGLALEEKIVIAQQYVLPEILSKTGLQGVVHFDNSTLKYIIDEYTCEAGVRKMSQVLSEIVGEINLSCLKDSVQHEIPIRVTIDDVKNNYLKDKLVPIKYKIHNEPKVGVINALWANQLKQGGVLPLQISFVPASKFLDLTLTGSLGDVMKESISVSLTNAWNLTSRKRQNELSNLYNNPKEHNQVYGLHVHCPSISTPKDGPSATTAFTVAIYSLLNNKKIKNHFGITGETSFDYILTQIGGLEEKIVHSIPAGITEFIYPVENQADFNKIWSKYKDNSLFQGIQFHAIEKIHDVFDLILEKE